MRNNSYSYRSEHRCQLVSEGRHKQRPHAERHSQIGHFLSLQSHITWVMRRSMSMRAVLHSLGYFFAAVNASLTNSAEPTGSMVLSIPSGKTKCVPCSYITASTAQVCGCSARRFSMRRIYFAVSQSASSSCLLYTSPSPRD